jgi:DNA-binding CsgD family transcriptional regulator
MPKDHSLIIEDKLNTIIMLLALQAISGKDYRQQVVLLSKAGLQPKTIANITGKTANNVKVTLNHIRKKRVHTS